MTEHNNYFSKHIAHGIPQMDMKITTKMKIK